MKKLLTIILVLCSVASFGQMRGGAQYDPGAARKNLSNVDASATPSMTSITLSDKVQAAWANILGDVYASGAVKVGAGTAAAPAHTFSTDPDTGIYSPGANILGFGVNGVDVASLSSTGLSLASPLAVANGGTGATTAAAGLAALGSASLNGSSTVDFSVRNGTVGGTLGVTGHSTLTTASFTGSVDQALGSEGTIRTRSITLADDAEISLTTLFGKSLSCANLFTVTATNARAAFIIAYTAGSANAVTLVSGLDHSITDSDGKLCIYPAGSGVYMLKNRLAAEVTFNATVNGFK